MFKLDAKKIFWALLGVGITICGMIVDSKREEVEFDEKFREKYAEIKAEEETKNLIDKG